MGYLYWACKELRVSRLLQRAKSFDRIGKIVGKGTGWAVIQIQDADGNVIRESVRLISRQELVSAALVGEPLSSDELFIATEWRQRFVVGRTELGAITELGGLERETDFPPRDLSIFRVFGDIEPDEFAPLETPDQSQVRRFFGTPIFTMGDLRIRSRRRQCAIRNRP